MIKEFIMNKAWHLLAKRQYDLFEKDAENAAYVQFERLFGILDENKDTEYGRNYSFEKITDIEQFQKSVPLTTYDDYAEYIEKIKAGGSGVLTRDAVTVFELSSGSASSATKLIPYNKPLKREFQSAIKPWLHDLYKRHKDMLWGKSYWSVTPVTVQKQYTQSGIPIGFEDDGEYFGAIEKLLLKNIFVTPAEITLVDNPDNFRYITLAFMLAEGNLRFISVWNPSFLLILMDYMNAYKFRLIDDFKNGMLTLPQRMDDALKSKLMRQLKVKKKRIKELDILFSSDSLEYEKIWRKLKLISTWADGNASVHMPKLKEMFKNTAIQAKGLLATECFVSFPYKSDIHSAVSYRSHFFEFIELENGTYGDIKLLHELEKGKQYSVVVTTGGGLYRYRLLDIIEVTGFYKKIPTIVFIGKENKIADTVGEKLNEIHVKGAVEKCLADLRITYSFYMMAPEISDGTYSYILYLKCENTGLNVLNPLKANLDKLLRQNFHYDYARNLEQLGGLKIFLIDTSQNPDEIYLNQCNKRGQKLGDIKTASLDGKTGWINEFKGSLI